MKTYKPNEPKHIEFYIEQLSRIHNNRYRYHYEDRNYNKNERIGVECPIHGIQQQLIRNHFSHGCKKCSMVNLKKTNTYTKEQFIEFANKKHKNRYYYSEMDYTDTSTSIEIICREHGKFSQSPIIHLRGGNCPKCRTIQKSKSLTKTTEQFILDARKIHGDRYDYSLTEYKSASEKVLIICNLHGQFSQQASAHSSGSNCPQCSHGGGNGSSSAIENLWLDDMKIPLKNRNKKLIIENKKMVPDGIDPENKIIYLFMGDYWHGNPEVYSSEVQNKTVNLTMGELYNKTLKEIDTYKNAGYEVIVQWEKDYIPRATHVFNENLDKIFKIIPNEDAAYNLLDQCVWKTEPICPHCKGTNIWKDPKRIGKYTCLDKKCHKIFTSRHNTIFHASQISLRKWIYAIYLLSSSNKKLSQQYLSTRIDIGRAAAYRLQQIFYYEKKNKLIELIYKKLTNMVKKTSFT